MNSFTRIRVLLIIRRQERLRFLRRRREIRDCSNPFSIPEAKFQELFRFPKHLAKDFVDELSVFLNQRQKRHGLPCSVRILTALRFYASGTCQRIVGDGFVLPLSQTSVSRCIKEVSQAINDHMIDKYIVFPQTSTQLNETKSKFNDVFGFPGVLGCIGGTHVLIKTPLKSMQHAYICPKGGYSKNIQIICDADLTILSVNPEFGGTTDNAFAWKSSPLQLHLNQMYQNGERNFWLLGDSSYPQQPWLMTPILNTTDEKQEHYNAVHKNTHNCIAKCTGILKSRFRCLSRGFLCYSPLECDVIINACSVLHNILVKNKIRVDALEIVDENKFEETESCDVAKYTIQQSHHLVEGRRTRNGLIDAHF